ncbi:MAG: hypothetical protein QXS92_02325 [Thermofilum sp.]|uniref:Uncharacterized protein n=1 Tax=Thermofilum pendens TaxID=2269 RepID=A0A7C4D3N4_THEPE
MGRTDYLGEAARPSNALKLLAIMPWIFLAATYFITEGFNVRPTTPPYLYLFASPALAVLAIVVAVMGYLLAKDEEPEWGSRIAFKAIQAAELASILSAVLVLVIIAVTYYLR